MGSGAIFCLLQPTVVSGGYPSPRVFPALRGFQQLAGLCQPAMLAVEGLVLGVHGTHAIEVNDFGTGLAIHRTGFPDGLAVFLVNHAQHGVIPLCVSMM